MKKVMQIVLVLMVLMCIYRYIKSEATILLAQEPEKEDYASETDREIENKTENELLEQIRSTVIGEVNILEKSIQANIEIEGWSRVRTWDLKYPYFSGDEVVPLSKINDQIYEWVRDRNMGDSDLEQTNLDFFIKDVYLHFRTHAYPSCREDSYVKWEVQFWAEAIVKTVVFMRAIN